MPHPHDLLVLRHGETEWNAAGRMQGGLDSPLTARGRLQSEAMGRLLLALGVTAESHAAWTSPQGRATETARLALGPAWGEIRAEPRLREIGMGRWAGLSGPEIAARWPGPEDEPILDFYARAPEGEGLDALWARTGEVLALLDRPAVVVTHGLTSRFLRTRAMGWDMDRLMDLPGGQGVVHRLRHGRHEVLTPSP